MKVGFILIFKFVQILILDPGGRRRSTLPELPSRLTHQQTLQKGHLLPCLLRFLNLLAFRFEVDKFAPSLLLLFLLLEPEHNRQISILIAIGIKLLVVDGSGLLRSEFMLI